MLFKKQILILLFLYLFSPLSGQDLFIDSLLRHRIQSIDPMLDIPYTKPLNDCITTHVFGKKKETRQALESFFFYQPFILTELRKHTLPDVFQYLPLALTCMNTTYANGFNTAGIWKMPSVVAYKYGLKITPYIDERLDVQKSTEAVFNYLDDLFFVFSDFWDVVFAYSQGAAGVNAAKIRLNNLNPSPWEMCKENTPCVAVLLTCYAYLANFYAIYDFNIDTSLSFSRETTSVFPKKDILITHLLGTLSLSKEEFSKLNPIFISDRVVADVAVSLPKSKTETFRLFEDSLYNKMELYIAEQDSISRSIVEEKEKKLEEEKKSIVYIVKSGDYLGKIASKYSVRVSDIMKWNNLKNDRINIGDRLIIKR